MIQKISKYPRVRFDLYVCISNAKSFSSCCSNANCWKRKTGDCRVPSCKTSFFKRESTRFNGRSNRFVIARKVENLEKKKKRKRPIKMITTGLPRSGYSISRHVTTGRLIFPLDNPRVIFASPTFLIISSSFYEWTCARALYDLFFQSSSMSKTVISVFTASFSFNFFFFLFSKIIFIGAYLSFSLRFQIKFVPQININESTLIKWQEWRSCFRLFAGRIEQANVSFYDGAGRSFPGPSSQELGDPSHQGQSQGQETRAA